MSNPAQCMELMRSGADASGIKAKARHREPTAHARARYRCFLPDLAGLARVRRVRPMPDLNHSSKPELGPIASASSDNTAQKTSDFRCKKSAGRPSLPDGSCRTI